MKDGERILAFEHASCRENDGDEVNTCIAEERKGGGFGEEFDIHIRDIPNHIVIMIYHGKRGNAFV